MVRACRRAAANRASTAPRRSGRIRRRARAVAAASSTTRIRRDEPQAGQRAADRQPADGAEVRERAVGRAPDDEPRASDAIPDASCWSDALKLMKLPRNLRLDAAGDERRRGAEPAGHEHEEQHRQRHHPGERQRRQMGVRSRIGPIEISARIVNSALLAVAVGEPADHLRRDERRRAAGEIDHREVRLRDADVGDVVGGDERDDREHRAHQHDHEGERPPVVGHAEDRPQLRHRAAAARRAATCAASGGISRVAASPTTTLSAASAEERRAPREVRRDPQRQRHAGDRRQRKCRRDDAVAVARRAYGTRSATIANVSRPARRRTCRRRSAPRAATDSRARSRRARSRR